MTFDSPTHELVANAHGNLARVTELLDAHPELLDARYAPWDERALEAAAHTGGRAIARLLLARGAAPSHVAWAMLGEWDQLAGLLRADPALAGTPGAHGIPLLFHAALSGDPRGLELVWDAGGRDGLDHALHAAVTARSLPALEWLLARGADPATPNFEGRTPAQVAQARGWAEGSERLGV